MCIPRVVWRMALLAVHWIARSRSPCGVQSLAFHRKGRYSGRKLRFRCFRFRPAELRADETDAVGINFECAILLAQLDSVQPPAQTVLLSLRILDERQAGRAGLGRIFP